MKIAINIWKTSFAIYTEKQLFSVQPDYQKKKTSASLKYSWGFLGALREHSYYLYIPE